MAPRGSVGVALAVAACALWLLPATASGALRVGFYQNSCPNAEALVRQAVAAAFAKDAGVAAGLIRLHFHDCFVRGCDASVLLTKNPGGGQTEREVGPNNPSLRGFDVIDAAKAAVERSCPRTVSCADIIAFAARDSVKLTGNVDYQVPAGRRDGRVSNGTEALDNLPPPTATAATLADMFANKFLTLDEMVVLSGAHSVGRSFCASFFNRVWTNNGTTPFVDAGLDPAYAARLRALCPREDTPATTPMDPDTPATLDNNYYKLLPQSKGLFFSDNQLRVNATMNALATRFAANEAEWKQRFVAAMVKMGHIEVQTGRCGEIRVDCNVVNPSSSSSSPEVVELPPGEGEEEEAVGVAVAAS
ncbi:peroxidase 1-like [Oryza brachyantha]|uniref:peroxidase 1-like n=1 Tax=Oryza brachyantha TaxID=4533 RepID=UPI0003EABED4|nr:peroxidase 1-like [Oryza brachyantha]